MSLYEYTAAAAAASYLMTCKLFEYVHDHQPDEVALTLPPEAFLLQVAAVPDVGQQVLHQVAEAGQAA